jgi:hypothetical protein
MFTHYYLGLNQKYYSFDWITKWKIKQNKNFWLIMDKNYYDEKIKGSVKSCLN